MNHNFTEEPAFYCKFLIMDKLNPSGTNKCRHRCAVCSRVSAQQPVVFCTRQDYLIILPRTWDFDSSSTSSPTITSGRGLWITSEPQRLQTTKKSILPPFFFYAMQVMHLWCKGSTQHEAKGKRWVGNSVSFMQMRAVFAMRGSIHLAKEDDILCNAFTHFLMRRTLEPFISAWG